MLENILILNYAIIFLALVVASLTDIKTREVPDWLSFSLIGFSIGSGLFLSFYHGYIHIFYNLLSGLAIGTIIGMIMFYSGQWGGGDSKLLIGIAAGLGFSLTFQNTLIYFLAATLLSGAVYGIIYSAYLAITNKKKFLSEMEKLLSRKTVFIIRIVASVTLFISLVFLIIFKNYEATTFFLLSLFLVLLFYVWVLITSVEKSCMIKEIDVNLLTEGDWLTKAVTKNGVKILEASKIGIAKEDILLL